MGFRVRLGGHQRAGKARVDQRRLGFGLPLGQRAKPCGGAHPFLQDAIGKQRLKQPGPRHTQKDLAQDRGKQHAGVKGGAQRPLLSAAAPHGPASAVQPEEQRLEIGAFGQLRQHRMIRPGKAGVQKLAAPPRPADATGAGIAEGGQIGGMAA